MRAWEWRDSSSSDKKIYEDAACGDMWLVVPLIYHGTTHCRLNPKMYHSHGCESKDKLLHKAYSVEFSHASFT